MDVTRHSKRLHGVNYFYSSETSRSVERDERFRRCKIISTAVTAFSEKRYRFGFSYGQLGAVETFIPGEKIYTRTHAYLSEQHSVSQIHSFEFIIRWRLLRRLMKNGRQPSYILPFASPDEEAIRRTGLHQLKLPAFFSCYF